MKKGVVFVLILSLVFVTLFLSTGCFRSPQRAIESAIERELQQEGITVQEDGEEVTLTQQTDTGDVQMSWGSSDLPDGIPSEVSIYSDMGIEFSFKESRSSDDRSTDAFQVFGPSPHNIDRILEWHESQYGNWDSFSVSSWSSDGDVGHMISVEKGSIDQGRKIEVVIQLIQNDGDEDVTIGYYIEDILAK